MKTKVYYNDKETIVVFKTKQFGNIVGRAKCHPNDSYKEDIGVEIATIRAKHKLAEKIYKNSQKEYDKTLFNYQESKKEFAKACAKLSDNWVKFRDIDREIQDMDIHR